MYSYSLNRKVKFKELKEGNNLLTFSDLLQNIFPQTNWFLFNEQNNYEGVNLALGSDTQGRYYLTHYPYCHDETVDPIKSATSKKDMKAVISSIQENIVIVDNTVSLQKSIHDKVLATSDYFEDWFIFLVKVKDRFLGKLDFSLLTTVIDEDVIFDLFSGKHIVTLDDFLTRLSYFKFLLPEAKLTLPDEFSALYYNWLYLFRDTLDFNKYTLGDILDYRLNYEEFLDMTAGDINIMLKEVESKENNKVQFVNTADALIQINLILDKSEHTVTALAFVDGYKPTIYLKGEVDKKVTDEIARLFGYEKVETKQVKNPQFLKDFCLYFVEKEGADVNISTTLS